MNVQKALTIAMWMPRVRTPLGPLLVPVKLGIQEMVLIVSVGVYYCCVNKNKRLQINIIGKKKRYNQVTFYFCYIDVDECALNIDNCNANAICNNIPGAFTCACKNGFTGNGVTCLGNFDFWNVCSMISS